MVGIKVLSVHSIMGLSANGKIRGEILPEGLLRLSFHVVCGFPEAFSSLKHNICSCVCVLVCGASFVSLPMWEKKGNHLWQTVGRPRDKPKERMTSLPAIVHLIQPTPIPTQRRPPPTTPRAANIAPLCISSSKWDSAFDAQTSFEPLWESKLKFVPLVNRGPCSQDPTGSPLPPSLPHMGGRRLRKRYLLTSNECWRGGSVVEEHCGSSVLLRIVLIPPLSRASPSLWFLSLKSFYCFKEGRPDLDATQLLFKMGVMEV